MTREQVIAWAHEAELHCHVKLTEHGLIIEDLQYFANLVAAAEREYNYALIETLIDAEREACAKLCDETRAARLAEQIRARGEK